MKLESITLHYFRGIKHTAISLADYTLLVGPNNAGKSTVSREEETLYILEGEITFTINGNKVVAFPGMFTNMPVGTPHSFKNESDKPAKMLVSVAPAGLENMFLEVGVPLADGATNALPPTKEEIEKLLRVAPSYGIEIRVPHHE
ncbi:MAG: cupin domain-containing protein [Pirellula sp.]